MIRINHVKNDIFCFDSSSEIPPEIKECRIVFYSRDYRKFCLKLSSNEKDLEDLYNLSLSFGSKLQMTEKVYKSIVVYHYKKVEKDINQYIKLTNEIGLKPLIHKDMTEGISLKGYSITGLTKKKYESCNFIYYKNDQELILNKYKYQKYSQLKIDESDIFHIDGSNTGEKLRYKLSSKERSLIRNNPLIRKEIELSAKLKLLKMKLSALNEKRVLIICNIDHSKKVKDALKRAQVSSLKEISNLKEGVRIMESHHFCAYYPYLIADHFCIIDLDESIKLDILLKIDPDKIIELKLF